MANQPKISILTSLFRSEKYLASYLKEVKKQSIFTECELVLVLNEASNLEKKIAKQFDQQNPNQCQLHFVDKVETLGASWNRAWKSSGAPLLAIWNVDDRRSNSSLADQHDAMRANPDWALCYGDYIRVSEYGTDEGKRKQTPFFSPVQFRRAFPQGGAFWLLRKDVAGKLGYFDEQFQVAPDLDYSFRTVEASLKMGRVDTMLGYFTDAEEGLSTRDGARQSSIERTAIQLRYGVFDKVRSEFQKEAHNYQITDFLNFGDWISLENVLPGHKDAIARRKPLWLLGGLRNFLRKLLKAIGILEWLYSLQNKYIGREL
jgi:hypothetical protein